MLELIVAASLAQAAGHAAPDPCLAVPQGNTQRSCPAWRSDGGSSRFAVSHNPASVVRGESGFEVSLRLVFNADQADGLRSIILRTGYDCAHRTSVVVRASAYNAAGALLEDRGPVGDEAMPEEVPAGSPNANLLTLYCPAPRSR